MLGSIGLVVLVLKVLIRTYIYYVLLVPLIEEYIVASPVFPKLMPMLPSHRRAWKKKI